MLPITSKHLTVQIITTTSMLITCMLLSSLYQTTDCLPITSKPIESTAENLAWEAWLMVPFGQQQQKTRKVTPKSIFIVPQKKNQTSPIQCPPGEHLFESRCIPAVNIDTEKLLIEQLTNFVVSSGGVYDYDYDEDISDPIGPEKLEGGSDIIPSSNSDTADAPLKFDIFRDNFPIGSGDSSGNRDSEDDNVLFIGERRRRPPVPVDGDLDTQGSSYGSQHDVADEGADDHSTLFLSGIDAILVPAVSGIQEKDQSMNFSIYQDVANATTVSTDIEILSPTPEKVVDLEQMLKNDSVFLDKDHELDTTTTEKSESTTDQTEVETTTLRLEDDEDVESKTEFVRSITEKEEEESTSTSTDSTEDTSTVTSEEEQDETTTTMEPSEEATTTTTVDDETTNVASEETTTMEEEITTTMTSSSTKVDKKEAAIESFSELTPLPGPSGDRFVYDTKNPPQTMDINAELKIINELVARNRKLLSTTTSSAESTPGTSTKIIPTAATSSTSSSSTTTSSDSSSSSTESSTDSNSSPSPTSSTAAAEEPALANTNPFWWLPTGWRVDRTDADRPLLLRFWSALTSASGSQAKV